MLEKLISIDPGTEQAGFARFVAGELVQAELIREKGSTKEQRAWRVAAQLGALCPPGEALVIEHPQIYVRSPGDPDDLLALALVVGGVLTLHGGGELVRPRTWKGQVPKKIMVNRILKHLNEEERALCAKIKDNHNVLDAVGVGLWKLKRLR
jgi:hypothetical protein